MSQISRRRIVRLTVNAVAGATVALGGRKAVRGYTANERIVLAAIGLGGRCRSLVSNFARRRDVEFSHLCDLHPQRRSTFLKDLESNTGRRPERLAEYRRVLDDPNVDGVIIATPDHWHSPLAVFACQAGKDVYVEKPPSNNVWEGRKMVEAARRYKRVLQVGTQNRSAPYIREALDFVRGGGLGTIHLCKVYNLKPGGAYRRPADSAPPTGFDHDTWLGPAPTSPFNPSVFRGGWHKYWAYSGGDLADDGVHQLDIARLLTGVTFPRSVHCTGGKLAFNDDREVPDTQVVSYAFDGMVMTFELTQWAPYMRKTPGAIRRSDRFPRWQQNATRIELYGTKNLMVLGRHGGGWQALAADGKVIAQQFGRPGDSPHRDDFLACMRSRNRPNGDAEEGHRSACLVHLANVAYRIGPGGIRFDAETEQAMSDVQANRLIRGTQRRRFAIPDVV